MLPWTAEICGFVRLIRSTAFINLSFFSFEVPSSVFFKAPIGSCWVRIFCSTVKNVFTSRLFNLFKVMSQWFSILQIFVQVWNYLCKKLSCHGFPTAWTFFCKHICFLLNSKHVIRSMSPTCFNFCFPYHSFWSGECVFSFRYIPYQCNEQSLSKMPNVRRGIDTFIVFCIQIVCLFPKYPLPRHCRLQYGPLNGFVDCYALCNLEPKKKSQHWLPLPHCILS